MPYKPTGRPPGRPRHPEPLTPAEQRVLRHLRDGHSNAEIAERLDISADAVKYHVSNMLGKLELEGREQLASWREPGRLSRIWAGLSIAGWKVAVGGGVALLAIAAGVTIWAMTHDGRDSGDVVSLDALMTGVLSRGIDGQPADGSSMSPSISDDGRFVAFESEATNLVKDDNNGVSDIFVVDRVDGSILRVSVAPGGAEANGASHRPAISGDGNWVAFDSEASNLVKDDRNGELDRALAHVPENLLEQLADPESDGGKAFATQVRRWAGGDVFVVRLADLKVEIVSVTTAQERSDLGSFWPSISYDGRFVVFESSAPNLVGEDRARGAPPAITSFTGFASDVFVRDRKHKTTTRISIGNDGTRPFLSSGGPLITPDGQYVTFVSGESGLAGPRQRQTKSGYIWSVETGKLRTLRDPALPDDTDRVFTTGFSRVAISDDAQVLAYQATFGTSNAARDQRELRGCFIEVQGEDVARPVDTNVLECTASGGTTGPVLLGHEMIYPIGSGGRLMTYNIDKLEAATLNLPPGIDSFFGAAVASSATGNWIAGSASSQTALGSNGRPLFQVIVFPR